MERIEAALLAGGQRYDSFYLYDQCIIQQRIEELQKTFPQYQLLYSVKANCFGPVLNILFDQGVWADAASLREVLLCHQHGLGPQQIYYSAPAKRLSDLEKAWDNCIIIADSLHELELLEEIAAKRCQQAKVGIRVHPQFAPAPSKFGVEEQQLFASKGFLNRLSHLQLVGIHVHLRSQQLEADGLSHYYQQVGELAQRCAHLFGGPLEFVNFGGGLGINYAPNQTPLDLEAVGAACAALAEQLHAQKVGKLLLETGRFPVCQAGWYAARIIDIKECRGEKFLLVQNTLNGFLRPSMALLVEGWSQNPAAAEPLYTCQDAFRFFLPGKEGPLERVQVAGNLCTAADQMARGILLPSPKIGDLLAVSNAGSYAYTLSPQLFAGQQPPAQLLLREDGALGMDLGILA